jgi:hypothetical protein
MERGQRNFNMTLKTHSTMRDPELFGCLVFFVALNIWVARLARENLIAITNIVTGAVVFCYLFCLIAVFSKRYSNCVRISAGALLIVYTMFVAVRLISFYFGNDA